MKNPSQQSRERKTDASLPGERFAGQGGLGTALLLVGSAIAVLAVIDRTAGLPFHMPRTWYANPQLWYFFAFGSFLSGVFLLRRPPAELRGWQPEIPGRRFERVIIYTRDECHLCDQAKDVLWAHRAWLPAIEEMDITGDSVLMEKFSEQIPVVEIDGQVRFRGQVNEILLRRLIEAQPPHNSSR